MKKSILSFIASSIFGLSAFATPTFSGNVFVTLGNSPSTQANYICSWNVHSQNNPNGILFTGTGNSFSIVLVVTNMTTGNSFNAEFFSPYVPSPGDSVNTGVSYLSSDLLNVGDRYSVASSMTLTQGGIPVLMQNGTPLVFLTKPTVTATATSICAGSSTTLTATGASSTTYTWSPALGLNTNVGSTIIATPTTTTTYTVTAANDTCTRANTITIVVGAAPVLSPSADLSVCPNASSTLSVGGATTYTWLPLTGLNIATGSVVTATPTVTTTYTVTGTTGGCSSKDSIKITVNSVILVGTSSQTICSGGSGVAMNVTGGNAYSWAPTNGLSDPTIGNPIANPSVNTTYTVTGTNGSCIETLNVTVVVKINVNPVTVTIPTNSNNICNMNVGNNAIVTFGGIPSTGVFAVDGVALQSNSFNVSNFPTGNHIITHTITDSYGCTNSDQTNLFVVSIPLVDSSHYNPVTHTLTVYGLFIDNLKMRVYTNNGTSVYTMPQQNGTTAVFSSVVCSNGDDVSFFYGDVNSSCFTSGTHVGIKELKSEDVKVYPNPIVDVLHVDVPQGKYQIDIVNALGQTVNLSTEEGGRFEILRNDLPRGLYFVKITSLDGETNSTICKKIIIQ